MTANSPNSNHRQLPTKRSKCQQILDIFRLELTSTDLTHPNLTKSDMIHPKFPAPNARSPRSAEIFPRAAT